MFKARAKGIMYDGVEYRSLRKAWEATGRNWGGLYKRLNDPTDYNVYHLNNPKQVSA